MKKVLLLLSVIFAFQGALAQDPVVSISTKIANQGSYVTGYDKEFKLIDPSGNRTWTAKNFNNNNSAWDNIRCGSKSAATTATITTDFAISPSISYVDVEISRYKTGSSNRMTSMSLLVSPNADMSQATEYSADISVLPSTTGTPVTISIPVDAPAPNMYYQLSIEMPKVYSEGVFSVNSLCYYDDAEDPEGTHKAILDFTNRENLLATYIGDGSILPGGDYAETADNNLNGASFSLSPVSVNFDKADGSIQPRWWTSSSISPELRLNPGNVVTFDIVKNGFKLKEIKFLQGTSAESYFNSIDADVVTNLGESGLTDKIWTAPDEGIVTNLTMSVKDYCRCGGIRITYLEDRNALASISEIEDSVCPESDADSKVEFFNLQGILVSPDNLTPGIYFRRHGTSTTNIVVK